MTEINFVPRSNQRRNCFKIARHFWRQCDQSNRHHRVQRIELGKLQSARKVRLRAQSFSIDVGPFKMHAQNARATKRRVCVKRGQARKRGDQVVMWGGHGGGQQCGRTEPRMRLCNRCCSVAAIHNVAATAAMDV